MPSVSYSRDGECIWRRSARARRAGIRRGDGTLLEVAATFAIEPRTLQRWIAHERATGSLVPKPKAGGWRCPIDLAQLHAVIAAAPTPRCARRTTSVGALVSAYGRNCGAPDVVILSNSLWHRRFSADPNIVGRKILLDGKPHEVVGVTPSGMPFYRHNVEADLPNARMVPPIATSSG